MKTLFTDAERAEALEAKRYPSKVTHRFNDSINYRDRERYGTNANGTKFRKG